MHIIRRIRDELAEGWMIEDHLLHQQPLLALPITQTMPNLWMS